MSTSSCRRAILAVAFACSVWAQDSFIVKAVEPEWGFAPDEAVITAPLYIEVIVSAQGKIVDARTEAPIPAALVRALQQYEMRQGDTPYGLGMVWEIRLPLRGYTGPAGGWNADVAGLLAEAGKLDASKARELEAKLTDDDATIAARSALVMWSAKQTDAASREMRARQVAWLVEHAPEAEVLRHGSAWIEGGGAPGSNPQAYVRIRQLWMDHFRTKRANAKHIGAAVMFLRKSDPKLAEDLLKSGAKLSYHASPELGALYAEHALTNSSSEFGAKARGLLAGSNDVRVLRGAWRALTVARLHALAGFEALCADVIRQLTAVQPSAPKDCDEREYVTTLPANLAALASPAGDAVRVDKLEQAKSIVKAVRPEYPQIARAARVQGRVLFDAVIGRDGKIKQLTFVSGHAMLRPSAEDAVRQWEYRPTIVGGEAVEVATEIEVNFTLN